MSNYPHSLELLFLRRSLVLTFLLLALPALSKPTVEPVDFNFDVRPILSDKCYFCHGPDADNRKAKLRLDTAQGAYRALTDGGYAVKPGSLKGSAVYHRITEIDPDEMMPPPEAKNPLGEADRQILTRWIEQGAKYDQHWSLKPLPRKVPVPQADTSSNPIDQFVAQALEKKGLSFSEHADRATLMRRVSFVLTGLPPTAEALSEYLADDTPEAYETLVDYLLKTDAYAERMAVDWLDLARYADTYGYQRDNDRDVWAWRDWVIRAFQKNQPYDEFITDQLAGDLIPEATQEQVLATAFNRLHMQKNEGGTIEEEFRVEYVADRAQTAATAFLGLTFECTRCHDHKYDPITQDDYFSLFAFFNNIDEAGLYSYFTKHVPTPTLFLMDAGSRKTLAEAAGAADDAKEVLTALRKSEASAYKAWKKTRSDKRALSGLVGYYPLKTGGEKKVDLVGQWPKELAVDHAKAPVLSGDKGHGIGKVGPYDRAKAFSLALWIKPAEAYSRAVVLHRSRAWTDSASKGYQLLVEEGQLSFALIHFYPGDAIEIRTDKKLIPGEWVHVTVTYDGSSRASGQSIYIDGELADTRIVKDRLRKDINHGQAITLGQRFRDRGFKNGSVDELYIFDREITALEVDFLAGGDELGKSLSGKRLSSVNENGLMDYYLVNYSEPYRTAVTNLAQIRGQHNTIQNRVREIMVMKDMVDVRPTYVLNRGSYDSPMLDRPVVARGAEVIYPYSEKLPNNRLGLAEWLTNPQHPLTSRVAVNRFWQSVFGAGIVTTPNDFGRQGALPSHPQLLNWLSRSFVDSGWDIRALLKQIVMSKTFKQSSDVADSEFKKDPGNAWLARGPRYRLSAEMLRDNALFAAGQLRTTVGGKNQTYGGTHRSLYTFWKRNAPPPSMVIFDAPRRQVCSVKRERTATPLQALVLMNDPQFTSASAALAVVALGNKKDFVDRVDELFLRLCSRKALEAEHDVLDALYRDQHDYFAANPSVAKGFLKAMKLGRVAAVTDVELAAWAVVSNAIMNLDASYTLR